MAVIRLRLVNGGSSVLSLTEVELNDGRIAAARTSGVGISVEDVELGTRRISADSVSEAVDHQSIAIPIQIDAGDGVVGYSMHLTYPPDLASYSGFERGSLTVNWGDPTVNATTPGEIIVVGAGVAALTAS